MNTKLLFLYTETPLHVGTGSTVSAIDLPIQRERATEFPHVQGSGIKGALRAQASTTDDAAVNILFGSDTNSEPRFAGAALFGEAQLVLFPVRSLAGVFAYATSPLALGRLARTATSAGLTLPIPADVPQENQCFVSADSTVVSGRDVILEEYAFNANTDAAVGQLGNWLATNALPDNGGYTYWRENLARRLVVLPEDAFRDFVKHSTEVTTRVRIDNDSKTVQDGALWTQEAVPPDALFVSTVAIGRSRNPDAALSADELAGILTQAIGSRIQLGGDETTGSGIVAVSWA